MYKNEKRIGFQNQAYNYTEDKYHFQKDKKPVNINRVDTKQIALSNKTLGYVGSTGFRPLHIIIKNMKLYIDHMNVLANDN